MVVPMKECGLATIWRAWATNAFRGPRPVAWVRFNSDANRSANKLLLLNFELLNYCTCVRARVVLVTIVVAIAAVKLLTMGESLSAHFTSQVDPCPTQQWNRKRSKNKKV